MGWHISNTRGSARGSGRTGVKTREEIIRDMCVSYRSDYDLNRSPSDPPWVAGLTPKERMGLWRTMEQIYEINIASKMEIKK